MIDWSLTVTAEARAAATLETARAVALQRLTDQVTAARSALITPLPGQEMIYMAKEAEAARWLAAGPTPDLADYPLLAAETGLTAPDAHSLAQLWLNMGTLWRTTAAGLEAWRLTTAAAILAATTVDEIEAAVVGLA